ncbi:MAG: methionyl-tRNA formyltransferase [Nitrospinota bacterium]|nr:methionyl-tRNA formyltransferase [Nitrospinota bacterium]
MRVVFMGTPEFSLPSLEALLSAGVEIAAVFTQPDRPAGRGRKLTPPPVKVRALERGLEVRQPERVRAADIAPLSPDAAVVVAYGQYLSGKLLGVPPLGGVNVHPSLLPRWRGAAPIQRALLAGDEETGVCTMRVAKEMDAGAILGVAAVAVGPRETSELLHDRLAEEGGRLLVQTLEQLERNEADEREQDPTLVTWADKLTKEEAPLDWGAPAAALDLRVRGLRPWPVAETAWLGSGTKAGAGPMRIWRAYPLESEAGASAGPGEVLGETDTPEGRGLRVRTGEGDLVLFEVQPPGGRRMAAADYLRGRSLAGGAVLGERV